MSSIYNSITFHSYVKFLQFPDIQSYVKYLHFVDIWLKTAGLRNNRNITVMITTKPQTQPSTQGSPELFVYIGFEFELAFVTQSPVSVFEGFASSGLMWHCFTLRLWKQMACSLLHSRQNKKTTETHTVYTTFLRFLCYFARFQQV